MSENLAHLSIRTAKEQHRERIPVTEVGERRTARFRGRVGAFRADAALILDQPEELGELVKCRAGNRPAHDQHIGRVIIGPLQVPSEEPVETGPVVNVAMRYEEEGDAFKPKWPERP